MLVYLFNTEVLTFGTHKTMVLFLIYEVMVYQ